MFFRKQVPLLSLWERIEVRVNYFTVNSLTPALSQRARVTE
jgi:hypothetical protein